LINIIKPVFSKALFISTTNYFIVVMMM